MRIAIATVQVPFTSGGAEIHAEMLRDELRKRGHEAEIVTIPFKWYPWESLVNSMSMGRMMDLTEANGKKIDRVIALKFPAFYVKHDNKVLWMLHQHRQAYDLWGSGYGDIEYWSNGEEIRDFIRESDQRYLPEAKKIFTNAQNTANRLKKYCGIDSTALYHPPQGYEKLHCESYGDFVFYPSRINAIKRQRLLVEAARYLKTDAKIILSGSSENSELEIIRDIIARDGVEDRVKLAGFISEEEKIRCYANCLAVYFGAQDEDYGYITLEGFFSEKPVIVHKDAGGPLEFVEDGYNGFVLDTDPEAIARCIDSLYEDRKEAERLGRNGRKSLEDKHLDWDYVIDQLLS